MDATAYILIALGTCAALGALFLALTSLHASRLTEALFDSIECALAERRQRRLEYRSDDAARPVQIRTEPRAHGLTLAA